MNTNPTAKLKTCPESTSQHNAAEAGKARNRSGVSAFVSCRKIKASAAGRQMIASTQLWVKDSLLRALCLCRCLDRDDALVSTPSPGFDSTKATVRQRDLPPCLKTCS